MDNASNMLASASNTLARVTLFKPVNDMAALEAEYARRMADVDRLYPVYARAAGRLQAATTYTDIATVTDYQRGHALAASMRPSFDDVDIQYAAARQALANVKDRLTRARRHAGGQA